MIFLTVTLTTPLSFATDMITRFPYDGHAESKKVCELSLQTASKVVDPDHARQVEEEREEALEKESREATANAVRKAVKSDDILKQGSDLKFLKTEVQEILKRVRVGREKED